MTLPPTWRAALAIVLLTVIFALSYWIVTTQTAPQPPAPTFTPVQLPTL